MAYHVEAKDNPAGDEDADVLVATNRGTATYGDFDLGGITGIRSHVALVPQLTSGGTVEVFQGKPGSGKKVGSYTLEQGLSTYGVNEIVIPLKGAEAGVHPVWFRFLADDESGEAVLGAIVDFEFLRTTLPGTQG